MPQINARTSLNAESLVHQENKDEFTLLHEILVFLNEASKPMVAVCAIVLMTALYKLMHFVQAIIHKLSDNNDVYACESHVLNVPTSKVFPFNVTKMIVDEADVLVSAYVNGSVYVWDLYNDTCSFYINRRFVFFYHLLFLVFIIAFGLINPGCSPLKLHIYLPGYNITFRPGFGEYTILRFLAVQAHIPYRHRKILT